MTDAEEQWKLAELDRLLNDPDVPMQPSRIWALLADLSGQANRLPQSRAGVAGQARSA
jgi:hypothetical protein